MELIRSLKETIAMLFAMSGIRLDKLTPPRMAIVALSMMVYGWMMMTATASMAISFFAVVFTFRYLFLFGSFIQGGIADWLIDQLGEEAGYDMYETITQAMFINGAVAFGVLLQTTQWNGLPLMREHHELLVLAGHVLASGGLLVNLWSARIIGVETYYYKDLFVGRFIGGFRAEGPYRWLKNPMYGAGQCAAYGAALMSGSLAGIIATLLNQTAMYAFYFLIERPHIEQMLAGTEPQPQITTGLETS